MSRRAYRSVSVLVCGTFACAAVFASALVESPARAAERAGSNALLPDSANCTACHTMEDGFSHPVGIVATMRVPAALPLNDGRITCETCHDGELGQGHSSRAAVGRDFLRLPEELGSLCSACHGSGAGRAVHGTGGSRAHLVATDLRRGTPRIDEESLSCMGCHDGMTATDAGSHQSAINKLGQDHPIGVIADEARRDREDWGLRPARSIDRRVRLFGRSVGCGSCHSVYSKRDNLLVMSNQGSALCLACHVQ